jgi:hypothetical protein
VIGEIHRQHRSAEFRSFLDRIDNQTPSDLDVHLGNTPRSVDTHVLEC